MSTALAIASVSLVLKDLLNNGLIDHNISDTAGNVMVTCLPPDKIATGDAELPQLNLFLYHVTPNQGWRNEFYPSKNSSGERISNPPLALDLHYLLTAYSPEELVAEILLGYGMQLFHENPILNREDIRRTLALPSLFTFTGGSALPANLLALSTSKLADQLELVKLTPATMNTEEMSKLWTAFQAKYRPTAAYMATVVLIESEKSTKSALPVKERNIYVKPFKQPVIEKIKSQSAAGQPIMENQKILINYKLVITGFNLRAENTKLNIDGIEYSPLDTDITDTQIIFQIPVALPAGIHGVQVISQIDMGTPEIPHRGVESNIEAFVLCPTIDPAPAKIKFDKLSGSGVSPVLANISLTVTPAIGEKQRTLLLMNQLDNLAETLPAAYSFQSFLPLSPPGPAEDIIIPVSGIKPGTYLIRIQVDGAESPLDTIIYSPVENILNGKYNSPIIIIT